MSIQIRDKSNKTFVVIGAPGSATSFISKMLEEGGVDMHNPKHGKKKFFYEDQNFVRLNTQILAKAGGDWTNPPSKEAILAVDVDKNIQRKINKSKTPMWGFKDPRTSLTGKKYLPFLEDDVYLICCFRRPSKTIASWENSGKISRPDKRALLNRFHESILGIIKDFCDL